MFSKTANTLNFSVHIIVATLMMLLTLGLTELFKDNAITQKELFSDDGCKISAKPGFS